MGSLPLPMCTPFLEITMTRKKKADSSLRFPRMTNLYIPRKRNVYTTGAQYHLLTLLRNNWGVVPVYRLKTCVK